MGTSLLYSLRMFMFHASDRLLQKRLCASPSMGECRFWMSRYLNELCGGQAKTLLIKNQKALLFDMLDELRYLEDLRTAGDIATDPFPFPPNGDDLAQTRIEIMSQVLERLKGVIFDLRIFLMKRALYAIQETDRIERNLTLGEIDVNITKLLDDIEPHRAEEPETHVFRNTGVPRIPIWR